MRRASVLLLLVATALAGCVDDGGAAPEAPVAKPVVLWNTWTHSGLLPGPDAEGVVNMSYPFDVPANATRIDVFHNATYTGLWPSVVAIYAPGAEEPATDTLDDCTPSLQVHVMDAWSCHLDVRRIDEAGTWTVEQWWQVGEGYEEFDITIDVYARG